ncbi:recombinase family protein [Pedobacter panaciterrae]|uniref:Recombinase family protein n=1 Tax=Pedobacter panaciterrae TaxID=363849 RepID=A0ABU8NHD5_9SPHI
MAENRKDQIAVGYIRVASIEDQLHIEQQMKRIREHCDIHGRDLKMVFIDEGQHSKNFKGPAWLVLEQFLKEHRGKVGTLVVSDTDRLTSDLGMLLLKQHELRTSLGVTIEYAGGRQLEQSKGFSLN